MSSSSSNREPSQALLVLTSERVPLTLPLAGIGERAIASTVDALFIVLLLVTLLFAYNLVGKGDLERDVA